MPLLRARLHGRDAAAAAHLRPELGALSSCRAARRADHPGRDRADRRPAALFDQDARPAARRDRRPVGRAHARMADPVAAAPFQFRGASRRPRRGSLLDPQADRDPRGEADRGAGLRAYRDAAQHADRRDLRLLRLGLRLCGHLVHLVAGDPGPDRRVRGACLVRVARRARAYHPGRRRSPSSSASGGGSAPSSSRR